VVYVTLVTDTQRGVLVRRVLDEQFEQPGIAADARTQIEDCARWNIALMSFSLGMISDGRLLS
jgi:hypothetical protein